MTHLMSRSGFHQKSQDVDKFVADLTHQRSDSEPGVDTVGTWGAHIAHPADERGCEAVSSRELHMRTLEINQKS